MLLLKLEIASSIRYPMLRLSCLASVGIHICISSKIASHPALRKRKPSRMLEFLIACDWWKPHLRFFRIPPTHTLHDLNVKTLSAEPLIAPSGALIAIPTYYWSTTSSSTPTFSDTHRSSIMDFHFLSHASYIKGNHWTHLLATCIPYKYNRTTLQDSAR